MPLPSGSIGIRRLKSWRAWLWPCDTTWPLSQVVLLAAIAALSVIWGALGLILHSERNEALEAEFRKNESIAALLQEQTFRVVVAVDQALLRVQAAVRAGEFNSDDLVRFANETGLAPQILVQLAVADAAGRLTGSNLDADGSRVGHVDLSDRDHVRVHLKPTAAAMSLLEPNGLFISQPVLGKVSRQWTLQLSRRLETQEGRLAGVVVASLNPEYFENLYRGVALGRWGAVMLVGSDGVIRARVVGETQVGLGAVVRSNSILSAVLRQAQAQGRYVGPSSVDQRERIVAFRRIGDLSLYIFVGSALDEALDAWEKAGLGMVAMALLLTLTILVASANFIAGVQRLENMNEELRRSEANAVAANKAKGAFLATMSHEIRTPMNAVLGLTHLLESSRLPAEAQVLANKIRTAGSTLLNIVNDILDYSKIEAGHLELEEAPFSLAEVLDNLATVMSITARDKALELAVNPPPFGFEMLHGDALRLEQILINLTTNAIKFTSQGFVVVDITVTAQTEQEAVLRFAVRDSGIGIPEEQQQAVFEPFSQADASTTRRFGGTGLGLPISKYLTRLMGGKIGVISEPGQGSEFWFTATFRRVADAMGSVAGTQGLKVLVADDSLIARETLDRNCAMLGWSAHTVDSAQAALDLVRARKHGAQKFDVVMLAWDLPGAARLLSAYRAAADASSNMAPILLILARNCSASAANHPGQAFCDVVVCKPITPLSLRRAVESARQERGKEALLSSAENKPLELAGVRLLVVDDSDINLEVAQRLFTAEGARVALAQSGKEALDWLKRHGAEVDLVLLDVQMPDMNGREVTRQLRLIPELRSLPVVALTAAVLKQQQDAMLAAGMTAVITKPIDVAAAVRLIRDLAGRTSAASPISKASAAPTSRPLPAHVLPGIDVRKGLSVWKEMDKYQYYLRRFVAQFANTASAAAEAPVEQAAALVHKLKGTAGTLGLVDVASAASAVEQALHTADAVPQALQRLQVALEQAVASIDYLAPQERGTAVGTPAQSARSGAADIDRVQALLEELHTRWLTASPDAVEPLLEALGGMLAPAQFEPLRNALENFDFRGGQVATQALINALASSRDAALTE